MNLQTVDKVKSVKYRKKALVALLVSIPGIVIPYLFVQADTSGEEFILFHLFNGLWALLSAVGIFAAILYGCMWAAHSGNKLLQVLMLVLLAMVPVFILVWNR